MTNVVEDCELTPLAAVTVTLNLPSEVNVCMTYMRQWREREKRRRKKKKMKKTESSIVQHERRRKKARKNIAVS